MSKQSMNFDYNLAYKKYKSPVFTGLLYDT